MASGTFTAQNKVRPGVYINFDSEPQPIGAIGERGVVAMALPLSWGAAKQITVIEAGEDTFRKLGYPITDPKLLLVKEALKRARTLLLYRLNDGQKARATVGQDTDTLVIEAKHAGVRGNDITVSIQKNVDDESKYDVITYVSSQVVDEQTVSTASELKPNDWVTFSGVALTETAGVALTGGEDGTVTNADHTAFLNEVEKFDFNTVALVSEDSTLKELYAQFVHRLRDAEGKKIQAVMANYPNADYEGVISVKNGVILEDGTTISASQACAWVAGATAAAQVNESLTYQVYDGAVDANPRFTNFEIIAALQNGEFLFTHNNGRAIVEQDINTFTSFSPTKAKHFSKNRVIRVIDSINNDFVRIFSEYFIGKVSNNDDGRDLFKVQCIRYLENLQAMEAIQNFDAETDIVVSKGQDVDSVYAEIKIQPVDAIEKIYMRITLE